MMHYFRRAPEYRTLILSVLIFGAVAITYLGFFNTLPAEEVRVQVNGLGITDGEIEARARELQIQDQRRGLVGAGSDEHNTARREAAIQDLIQTRLIDYEVQHRQISRDEAWDFLARVKPGVAGLVKERYLQILESRAIILRLRDKNKGYEETEPVSSASF